MLQKLIKTAILAASFWLAAATVFAQPVSSTKLINNAALYDNKNVSYKGEVVGDIMARDRYAWMNVNDGQNAIGIWADRDLIKDVRYGGSYKFVGDTIEVRGAFHRSCPEHGGDLDIHAQAIDMVIPSREMVESLNYNKLKVAFILLVVLLLFLLVV